MPSRRTVLAGAAALAAGSYVHVRGLRYPRMGFEPRPLPVQLNSSKFGITLADSMFVAGEATRVRAIGLEPEIVIDKHTAETLVLSIGNVSKQASLVIDGQATVGVDEQSNGINRTITLSGSGSVSLRWSLGSRGGGRFAIIGDTGAGLELEWVLQRATNLGAEFLLHLGDFNYVDGEYERAIELFNSAPLPCFVTIGNHDFNDSGLVYDHFLQNLGPLNHRFSFAGTQFINLDTAADFLPAYSGLRGRMLDQMEQQQTRFSDHVCFTHRNFLDPRPGRDHTIGGVGERPWLADKLNACQVKNIFTGHVHRSAEMEYRSLKQYTVGEGLGFEDIVHERLVAQLLLGTIEMGQAVSYQWAPIEMPWSMHTSPEHEEKLLKEHSPEKLEWYRNKLAIEQPKDVV